MMMTDSQKTSPTLMEWLLLEAGIAGLLLVFIVWWTLPKKDRKRDQNDDKP